VSHVTIWSLGILASHYVVERSYPKAYALQAYNLPNKPGVALPGPDGRRYMWLPQGVDANALPRIGNGCVIPD